MNLLFIVCCAALLPLACCKDYYQVLGISRSSSTREIKVAYRRLAKKWHPDKNDSPEAHDKFLEITEAYEVLSSEDRRWKYDNGHLEENQDPFANFNKKFYFHFPNVHRSDSINIQYYKDRVIPASYDQPYLLYFYHDFCPSCMSVWREWDQLKSELAGLQVGMETVHTGVALRLVRMVGVTHAPSIVAVNDGHLVHFKGYITTANLKQFLKNLLPSIVMLKDVATFNQFLHHMIVRNRPRLIVCSHRPSPSLLLLMVAKKHKQFIDFGFIDLKSVALSRHLGVHKDNTASILMFKGDGIIPDVNIKLSSSLSVADTLWEVAKENKLLVLPRISSPEHWTMVSSVATRYRCVFLVVPGEAHYNGTAAQAIRQLAGNNAVSSKPIRFGLLDSSKQAGFINSLSGVPDTTCDPYHPLLVVQRYLYQDDHVRYAWITDWCGDIKSVISKTLGVSLLHSSTIVPIVDEEAPGFIRRLFDKVLVMWSDTVTFVSLLEIDALIPLLCVTTCMVLFSVLPFIGSVKSSDDFLKRCLHHFNDRIYLENVVDNATRNCILVVLLWGQEWNNYEDELLISYNTVAMCYKQEGRRSVLFSVGKACHHKWYYSLLEEADLKDDNMYLSSGRNIVAVALYSKKKAISVTNITVSSTMEHLLGLDSSDTSSLRDQMSIWLDRILDGTADKKVLTNWPAL